MNMNQAQLDKIQSMSEEQLYQAIYIDPLTDVNNRKAFDENETYYKYVAIIDLDSLKYVNDHIGHRAGDALLRSLGHLLLIEFPRDDSVYRLSGDEFAVLGTSPINLAGGLERTRMRFPRFSYGVGRTLETADRALRIEKHNRVLTQKRSPRGERPPWHCESTLSQS